MLGTSKKNGGKGKHLDVGKGTDTANKIQDSILGKRAAAKRDAMLGENTSLPLMSRQQNWGHNVFI
jgi:hypothetical protein